MSFARSSAEPPITSVSPTATRTGGAIVATISAVIGARDERMHAASALRSLFVRSAKARNVRAVGLVTSSMLSSFERPRNRPRSGHAADHIDAEPAEHEAHDAIRMRERQKRGNARAHRIADDVRARDAEMIEQAAAVFRHQRRTVVGQFDKASGSRHDPGCRTR